MTRTPDEIKKGLECCMMSTCEPSCPYDNPVDCGFAVQLLQDALALIQQLQAQNDTITESFHRLKKVVVEQGQTIKQLEAERDALMHYLHSMGCETCLYDDYDGSEPPCINCTATRDLWQFQGVQKEE
jgi:hypothetical protein